MKDLFYIKRWKNIIFSDVTVYFVGKGTGDLNIKVDCMNLQKTYVIEDCEFTIIEDTKVSTTSGDKTFHMWDATSDFIVTADYYPTEYWEWFMLDKRNADGSRYAILGTFSSSYDKSSYLGITNLGYNGWKHVMIKWENNTLTLTYGNTTVSKDMSNYQFPLYLGLTINRANTRFKNLKLKKL